MELNAEEDDPPHAAAHRSPSTLMRLELGGEVASVPLARRRVGAFLASRVCPDVWDDTLLLVGELLANSVLHTASGREPYGKVTLTVLHRDGVVRVDVIDDGSTTSAPRVRDAGTEREGGRGLLLVDRIADRWGTCVHGARRVVWCELGERKP
ncbi:hypothetical protein Ssi02_25280 [Sinosporangium siamense]|uniref:Histidine kinase/HSP90-like ATPase domain-containing protein n=1 Tax=Sinosporangium siamense TaxID=1367973 RepID=A0A919V7N8_9ACTN|nr:hypothetical protein Ssi02_25280 [Sinosporangium siamense]